MTTTATFIIDFGSVENAFLTAELDSERNNGKTSFQTGDEVFFKIYSNSNYTIELTSGTIVNGEVDVAEPITDEVLTFVKGAAPTTQKKIRVGTPVTASWFGNNLGSVTIADVNKVQAANADENSIGVASIDYTAEYNAHSVVPPANMPLIFHILVYITAVA